MKSNNLKDKLQNRTIAPSSNSWEKLNDKLAAQENKENGKKWLFLKYAAVILVFISIGFYFFKSNYSTENNPVIAEPSLKNEIKKTPLLIEEAPIEVAEIVTEEKVQPKVKKAVNQTFSLPKVKKDAVAVKTNIDKEVLESKIDLKNTALVKTIEETKIAEVNKSLTNEIDILLLNAQLKRNLKQSKQTQRVVSANALLGQVEDDLDKDLKQQLFESIINTLKNPKEVVTDIGN